MNNETLTNDEIKKLEVGTQVKLIGGDWPHEFKGRVVRITNPEIETLLVKSPPRFIYGDLTHNLPLSTYDAGYVVGDYSVRLANNRDIGFEGTKFEVGDVVELTGEGWWQSAQGLFRGVTECPCETGCGESIVSVPPEFTPGLPEYLEDLGTGYEATLVTLSGYGVPPQEPKGLATDDVLSKLSDKVDLKAGFEKIAELSRVALTFTTEDPKNYYRGTDVLDFIERHELGFPLGNAVKYISRAGKKPGQELVKDLKKAIDYIQFVIEKENDNDR